MTLKTHVIRSIMNLSFIKFIILSVNVVEEFLGTEDHSISRNGNEFVGFGC